MDQVQQAIDREAEDRARAERTAQEERRREDDRRQEEQRRQDDRRRQEQQTADRRGEDRARAERTAQEERRREDDRRQEEQRRQDDRRRQEQQAHEQQRRQAEKQTRGGGDWNVKNYYHHAASLDRARFDPEGYKAVYNARNGSRQESPAMQAYKEAHSRDRTQVEAQKHKERELQAFTR